MERRELRGRGRSGLKGVNALLSVHDAFGLLEEFLSINIPTIE